MQCKGPPGALGGLGQCCRQCRDCDIQLQHCNYHSRLPASRKRGQPVSCTSLILLLLLLLPAATTPLNDAICRPCPAHCQCPLNDLGLCQVICDGVQLRDLPSCHQLPAASSIHSISFSNCSIDFVPADYFSTFYNLHSLNLSANQIQSIESSSLQSVTNLRTLDLQGNKLSSLPSSIFAKQAQLQYLNLTGNPLWVLPKDLFINLHSLKILSLENISLTFMKENQLIPLVSLEKIALGGNPWHCTCELVWLGSWLLRQGNHGDARCATPASLTGHLLTELPTLLNCQDSRVGRQLLASNSVASTDDSAEDLCVTLASKNLPCEAQYVTSCAELPSSRGEMAPQHQVKFVSMQRETCIEDCRFQCFHNGHSLYNYQPGNWCVCGRLADSVCDCGEDGQHCQGHYIKDTSLTALLARFNDLRPVSTTEGVHINVTSLLGNVNFTFWTSQDENNQALVDNVLAYRFASAGRHDLYMMPSSVRQHAARIPVLVQDPITYISLDGPSRIDSSTPVNFSLVVSQGTSVRITWSLFTPYGSLQKVKRCASGWQEFSQTCILPVVQTSRTFSEAVRYCSTLNAHLVELKSKDNVKKLSSLINNESGFYIGATLNDHQWKWVSDKSKTFFSNTMEPTSQDQSCVTLLNSRLHPTRCGTKLPFVCQASTSSCEHGGQYYMEEDKCYKLVTVTGDWQQAQAACRGLGGDLASIKTEPLLTNLQERLLKEAKKKMLWLGLRSYGSGINIWTEDFSSLGPVPGWSKSQMDQMFATNTCMVLENSGPWTLRGLPCNETKDLALCSYYASDVIDQVPIFNTGANLFGQSTTRVAAAAATDTVPHLAGSTTLHLFPGYWFQHKGVIQHWIIETGLINKDIQVHLQVYDVHCPPGEFTVSPDCSGSAVVWCSMAPVECSPLPDCPVLSQYCPWNGKCQALHVECPYNNNIAATVGSLYGNLVPTFTMVAETVVQMTPEHSNQHVIIAAGDLNVEKKYMIAIQQPETSSAVHCEQDSHSLSIRLPQSSWLKAGDQLSLLGATVPVDNRKCRIQAVYTQPVTLNFISYLQNTDPFSEAFDNLYHIKMANDVSSVSVQKEVTYISQVLNFTLIYPELRKNIVVVEPYKDVPFLWSISSGSSANFQWNLKTELISFSHECSSLFYETYCKDLSSQFVETYYNFQYQPGAHALTALAFNHISEVPFNFSVITQVPIAGLRIVAPALWPFNSSGLSVKASVTAGSDVNFTWIINGSTHYNQSLLDYAFSTAGVYHITLHAENLLSSKSTQSSVELYTLAKPRDLNISIDKLYSAVNSNISLRIAVSANVKSRLKMLVDFQDGSTLVNKWSMLQSSSDMSVVIPHSYSQAGLYTIWVAVVDDNLLQSNTLDDLLESSDAVSETVVVYVVPVIVSTSVSTATQVVAAGDYVTFIATASPQSPALSYNWNFGDGYLQSTTAGSVQHQYHNSGTYTVQVLASNHVSSQSAALVIKVQEQINSVHLSVTTPVHRATNVTLQASIEKGSNVSYIYHSGVTGESSHETNESSYRYVYTKEGQYNASVMAYNDVSNSTGWVTVYVFNTSMFAAACIEGPSYTTVQLLTTFSVLTVSHKTMNLNYEWSVNNSAIISGNNIQALSYVFSNNGIYIISVKITNRQTSSSANKTVYVQKSVTEVNLSTKTTLVALKQNQPSFLSFDVSVTEGSDYSYRWNIDNKIILTESVPSYNISFNKPGIYTITLEVFNKISSQMTQTTIKVQEMVDDLEMQIDGETIKSYIASQRAHRLSLVTKYGSSLQYKWMVSPVIQVEPVQLLNVIFPTTGYYTISGTAYNEVSQMTVNCTVNVIEPLVILAFSPLSSYIAVNTELHVQVLLSSNTSIEYKWQSCSLTSCGALSCFGENCQTSFKETGIYNVTVSVENHASTASKTAAIIVQSLIQNAHITSPSDFLFVENKKSFIASGKKLSLIGFLSDDFGATFHWTVLNSAQEVIKNWTGKFFDHTFNIPGEYDITLNISNNIDMKILSEKITVEDVIANLHIVPLSSPDCDPGYTLCYQAVVDFGTGVEFKWQVLNDTNETVYTTNTVELIFTPSHIGYYSLELQAENEVSRETLCIRVLSETPISATHINVDTLNKVSVFETFPVRIYVDDAPGLMYKWTFFDAEPPGAYITAIVEHTFNQAGTYYINLTISNGYREVTLSTNIVVYPEVASLTIVANSSSTTTHIPVAFEAVTMHPSSIVFEWQINSTRQNTTSNLLIYSFEEAGTFRVAASYVFNESTYFDDVIILAQEPIVGLELTGCDEPIATNEEVLFMARIESGTKPRYKWSIAGIPDTGSVSISFNRHSFDMPGVYNVSVECYNNVSKQEVTSQITVQTPVVAVTLIVDKNVYAGQKVKLIALVIGGTNLTYSWYINFRLVNRTAEPLIETVIETIGTNFVSVEVKNDISRKTDTTLVTSNRVLCEPPEVLPPAWGMNRTVLRSSTIEIETKVYVNCTRYKVNHRWRVYYGLCDKQPAKEVDLQNRGSFQSLLLIIMARTLAYGEYCAVFRTWYEHTPMEVLMRFDLTVVASNPIAIIAGGTERTYSTDQQIVLDGTQSYDPDALDGHSPVLHYHWKCATKNGGICFEDKFVDKVVISHGLLEPDTNITVQLDVFIEGRSKASNTQTLIIAAPTVSVVSIECVSCRESNTYTMSSTIPIKLLGSCHNCGGDVYYEWSIFDEDMNPVFINGFNSTTGLHSQNLAVKDDILDAKRAHYFHLTAWSHRQPKPGYARLYLKANQPPTSGTCNLTVQNYSEQRNPFVTALIDTITITCTGWRDPDDPIESPLTYHMFVQRGGIGYFTGDWYPLYRGTQGYGTFYLSQWTTNSFVLIHVEVIDRMGAISDGFITPVKIYIEAPEASSLTETTMKTLPLLVLHNDAKILRQYCLALAIQLSLMSNDEEYLEERMGLRQFILMSVHSTINSISNIEDVQQFVYIVQALTANPFELPETNETFYRVLDILNEVTERLMIYATPANNGDHFLPTGLIETVANIVERETITNIQSIGNHPDFPQDSTFYYMREYVEVAHVVMVIYSMTQVSGERPFSFQTQSLNSYGIKSVLANMPRETKISDVQVTLPRVENIGVQTQEVFQSFMTLDFNPFNWGHNGHPVTSKVCSLSFHSTNGSEIAMSGLKEEDGLIEFHLPVSPHRHNAADAAGVTIVSLKPGQTLTSSFNLSGVGAALIQLWILPNDSLPLDAGSQLGQSPSIQAIRPPDSSVVAYLGQGYEPLYDRYDQILYLTANASEQAENLAFFIAEKEVKRNTTHYITLTNTDEEREAQIHLELYYFQCMFYDETSHHWDDYGCSVSRQSTINVTICRCNHLTFFGSSVHHSPFIVEFRDLERMNIKDNPIVIIVVSVIAGVYLIVLMWARHFDGKDLRHASILPQCGQDGCYKYEINIITGRHMWAGTSAHVGIILYGTEGKSGARHLTKQGAFHRNSDDSFLIGTDRSLGDLTTVKLWHDNTGLSPSWYVHRVVIKDLHTKKRYYFIFNRWLSLEVPNGCIEYDAVATSIEELVRFEQAFKDNAWRGMSDTHIWLSLINRPPKSRFTRIQRVTCCVTLFYCFMMASAVWYGVLSAQPTEVDYALGHIWVNWQDVLVGILASVVAFPPVYILIVMFKYSRPKPKICNFDEKSETAQTIEIDAYCDVSSAAGSSFISRSSRSAQSGGHLKRSASDISNQPRQGFVGRLRRTGALKRLFRLESLDDITDTSSALSGFTNNNSIKDDLAKRIPGSSKPLWSKDGIMEWPETLPNWWEAPPSASSNRHKLHKRTISDVSEDSSIVTSSVDIPAPDRSHPRIVVRRPTAQTVEDRIDEKEEEDVSPQPCRKLPVKDKEEAIPMKCLTVDATMQTDSTACQGNLSSDGSTDVKVPNRRRRRCSVRRLRFNSPMPKTDEVPINKENFTPRNEADLEIRSAIEEIEANMVERTTTPAPTKPVKQHSQNTSRGHQRNASENSTDSYETVQNSEKSGYINQAFIPDEGSGSMHKRQESGVSLESEVSESSDNRSHPLHKTRSSKVSKRWDNIVIPENLGEAEGSGRWPYDSEDSDSWALPPIHQLSRTSTLVSHTHTNSRRVSNISWGMLSADTGHIMLPHWMTYLTFFLCFILCVFCIIVTLMYGNAFGPELALKWLLAFFMAFLVSVFLIEPAKVIFLAFFVAIFTQTPDDADDQAMVTNPMLEMNETIRDVRIRPVGGFALMQAKEETQRLKRMRLLLRQFAVYSLFFCIFLAFSYSSYNTAYTLNHTTEVNLGWRPSANDDSYKQISWYDNIYKHVLPNLYNTQNDNSQLYLLGVPRLRQIRGTIGSCSAISFTDPMNQRYGAPEYVKDCRQAKEDTSPYLTGWYRPHTTTNYTWTFTPQHLALGKEYAGKIEKYHGGGYIVKLASSETASKNIIIYLGLNDWIDRRTKAVFLEATYYHPPLNTYTTIILAAEFPMSGGTFYSSSVSSVQLMPWKPKTVTLLYVLASILVLVCLYFLIHIALLLWQQRCSYFLDFWNCYELTMVGLTIASLAIYVKKVIYDTEKIAQFGEKKRDFVSITRNLEVEKVWRVLNGWVVFLLTVWIGKQTRFVKSWSIHMNTIQRSVSALLGAAVLMAIIIISYAQVGNLWFGTMVENFNSVFQTLMNLVVLIHGTFTDLNAMLEVNPVFTHCFVISYMTLTMIGIMGLVIAILNSTYHMLRKQTSYHNNLEIKDYEMVEFTVKWFKKWLGLTKEKPAFRRVKFQGLASLSTASSMKSEARMSSAGSSSGMSAVIDQLEAESQAYLDGLIDRALPTWDNMLHKLEMVEEEDHKEREVEKEVYCKLLCMLDMKTQESATVKSKQTFPLDDVARKQYTKNNMFEIRKRSNSHPNPIKSDKSECNKSNEERDLPDTEKLEPNVGASSKPRPLRRLQRRLSDQGSRTRTLAKSNKIHPARAKSEVGFISKKGKIETNELSTTMKAWDI